MSRVIYSAASSLDGFIATDEDEFDWIPHTDEIDWKQFLGRFGAVVMGRSSYEVVAGGEGGAQLPDLPTYVFSETLDPAKTEGVTVVRGIEGILKVKELREAGGKDIWLFGGGVLFGSLLEAGLVDGLEVAIVPVLLGSGKSLVATLGSRRGLDLTGVDTFPNGMVLMSYDVRALEES